MNFGWKVDNLILGMNFESSGAEFQESWELKLGISGLNFGKVGSSSLGLNFKKVGS